MRENYLNTDPKKTKDNYALVCEKWRKIFLEMDVEELSKRFGLELDGEALYITYFCENYRLDRRTGMITPANDPEKRLSFNTLMCIYHLFYYSKPEARIKGEFIPFRQVKGAAPYDPAFQKTVLKPLAETFSGHPDALRQACQRLQGRPIRQGDAGYVIDATDCLPITVVFWDGDEEFEAQANILFDAAVTDFLHEETVVCLASWLVQRLTEESGLPPKGTPAGQEY